MTAHLITGVLIAIWLIVQSGWVLAFRPEPPAGAQIATRRSRTTIAVISLIFGFAYLLFILFA